VSVEPVDELLVTARGYEDLRAKLEALRGGRRREMSERLQEARAGGDLADNAALYDLLEEQAQLERRIALLNAQLAAVRVAEPPADGTAGVGSYVRVRDATTGETAEYELVGAVETDVGDGRVSVEAPVGRALVGGRRGDTLDVTTPRGSLRLTIVGVRAPLPRGCAGDRGEP
jgi:transcription elongation factor GreA